MVLSKRTIGKPLIFHSDRDVQYASKESRKQLKANCLIVQSTSRKGNCWDNAVAESFFKALNSVLVYHEGYILLWSTIHTKEPEVEFMNIKNAA